MGSRNEPARKELRLALSRLGWLSSYTRQFVSARQLLRSVGDIFHNSVDLDESELLRALRVCIFGISGASELGKGIVSASYTPPDQPRTHHLSFYRKNRVSSFGLTSRSDQEEYVLESDYWLEDLSGHGRIYGPEDARIVVEEIERIRLGVRLNKKSVGDQNCDNEFFTKLWRGYHSESELTGRYLFLSLAEQSPEVWGFWFRWFDGFTQGKPLDRELQRKIALIETAVWEAGTKAVAAEIARIEAEWLSEKLPQAEEIRRSADGRYEVLPVATDPDLMIDRLFQQLDFSLDIALRGHNVSGFNDLCTAYKYLDHTRKNCRDDPNAVHMHLRLAREIIEGHLKSGTYLSEDGLTALVSAMERHEVQLRADHPVVRAAHETFVAQRIRELDDEKRLQIAAEFRGVSDYSKDRLQEEYGLDAETLESDSSAEAQSDAVKRSGGRSQKMSLIERASNTAKDIDGSAANKATGLMLRLNKLAELLTGLF